MLGVAVEWFAQGEAGRTTRVPVPWADLVVSNTGLLEALYRERLTMRPRALDVGDIVRVPDVGRFVVLSHGWALVGPTWTPPLDARQRPEPDERWVLPDHAHVIDPVKSVDLRDVVVKPPARRPRPPKPKPPDTRPLADASRRLRARGSR